jgi:hypothetical protein
MAQLYLRALGFVFVASYDSQGYKEEIIGEQYGNR